MEQRHVKQEYLESELTSRLIRFAYDIFDELGYGLSERIYHRAYEQLLKSNGIQYSREKYGAITFKGSKIGKYFLDFLVEGKIALEFKVRNDIYYTDINQLLNYIKSEKLPLGLLIVFSKGGLKLKRIIN